MNHAHRSLLCCLTLLMVFLNAGCSKEPIRHLSSDSCLIAQGTTKQDVLTYMGTPKFKQQSASAETWIFVEEHRSLLKKTPVINWVLGTVSYDLVYISFNGDIVSNCQYRAASEEEYNKANLSQAPASK